VPGPGKDQHSKSLKIFALACVQCSHEVHTSLLFSLARNNS
jgi:hypothetical protein